VNIALVLFLGLLFVLAALALRQHFIVERYVVAIAEAYEYAVALHRRLEELEAENDEIIRTNHELAFAPRALGNVSPDIRA